MNLVKMKVVPIILLVLFAITATAQNKVPKDQRTAGDELKLASKFFYIGTGLLLTGVVVGVATGRLEHADTDTDLTGWYIGAGIAAVGIAFIAVSASHYRKAGVKLNKSEKHALKIKTSRDGVTLAMQF